MLPNDAEGAGEAEVAECYKLRVYEQKEDLTGQVVHRWL